jgi:predicted small metal-binding protein
MADDKIVRCDCGYRLRGRSEERQVADVRRHAWEAHGISFSTEEALAVLLRSQLELGEREPDRRCHAIERRTDKGGAR